MRVKYMLEVVYSAHMRIDHCLLSRHLLILLRFPQGLFGLSLIPLPFECVYLMSPWALRYRDTSTSFGCQSVSLRQRP
ncbi:hypothetical protein PILCRDRAFT_821355, partial [Piloderma croceum F 1598]